MSQMALPLQLADHAVFASFLNDGNETLVAALEQMAYGHEASRYGGWLWGSQATGKTHLLQAVCAAAGDRAAYVPMSLLHEAGPAILEGLTRRDLICIDDIDFVAGEVAWETGLFSLCNQALDTESELLVSASSAPRESKFQLADLRSRLTRLPAFHVATLSEEARVAALQLRSRHRGLELPGDTARYLLKRSRRDMASLYEVLDRLDREALRAKRRLTIPFVRGVLQSTSD